MPSVIRPLARAAAILVAGPYLLLASALAPEHIHEPESGHDHAVAHSHFGPHTAEAHHIDPPRSSMTMTTSSGWTARSSMNIYFKHRPFHLRSSP
jgi:hypothetical protein